MAEQELNGADVRSGFEQVNGEGVAQSVRGNRLGDAGPEPSLLASAFHGVFGDGPARNVAWEELILRPDRLPIAAQRLQHFG